MAVSNYLESITNLYFSPETLRMEPSFVVPEEEHDFVEVSEADTRATPARATPMQSRETEVVWPIIKQPEQELFDLATTPLSSEAPRVPVALLSVSSLFLEAAAQLRDYVLSYDDPSLGVSFAKLAAVTTITLTAVALFEASNITEIAIRAMVFSCTYGFTAVWLLAETLNVDTEEMFGDYVHGALKLGAATNLASLAGMIHGVFIDILTPLVFSYHMMCNTESNMPHIGVITNQATLTLQDSVVKFFNDLPAPK